MPIKIVPKKVVKDTGLEKARKKRAAKPRSYKKGGVVKRGK